MKIITLILISITLISCDANAIRRNKLKEPTIMKDTNWNTWLVKHKFGNSYTLEYIPTK